MVFHDHMLKSFLFFFTFSRVILVNKTQRSIIHKVSRKNIKGVKSFMFIFEKITHTKLLQIIKNWPLSSKYVQELFHRHSFLWQKPTRQFLLHWQSVYSYTCINSSNLWKLKFLRSFTRVLSILIFFSVLRFKYIGL